MFWSRKKSSRSPSRSTPTILDPDSRLALEPKTTPGYYPGFHALDQKKFWDKATRDLIEKRVIEDTPIRFFTATEVVTMKAVVERILPQDDRKPETRISILSGIDERLYMNKIEGFRYEDMPSDQEAYRIAISAIESMAQALHNCSFSELKTLQQEELLQSLDEGAPLAAKDLWKQMNLKRFWTMLVSDCCAIYYAHPSAWDEIGFGGPAYPRGYMRLEDGEPEPWEVEEKRYEWLAPDDTLSDRAHQTEKLVDSQDRKAGGR